MNKDFFSFLTRAPWPVVGALGLALALSAAPTKAQGLLPTLGGAVAGSLAGGAVSVAGIVLAAQDDHYLWDWSELRGWPAVPVIAGAALGGLQGAVASDRLGPSIGWSALGAVTGAGLGVLIGPSIWGEENGRWAGLLIGAGTGVLAGWIAGTLVSAPQSEAVPSTPAFTVILPLGFGR